MTINERDLLFKLLYQVMIEIREESYLQQNKKIHALSDLVHNLPLMLLKAEEGRTYSDIIKKLEEKAQSLGIQNWLKATIEDVR